MAPPFTYDPYRNPYVQTIAQTMLLAPEARARAAEQSGQAQAQAAQQSGQAWGNAAQQIGQIPQQIQQQQQQQQQLQQNNQLVQARIAETQAQAKERAMQVTRAEMIQKQEMTIDEIMKTSLKPDPMTGVASFDRPSFEKGLIEGNMGHLYPALSETIDKLDASAAKRNTEGRSMLATSLLGIEQAGFTPQSVLTAAAFLKANGVVTSEQLTPVLTAMADDASPESVKRLVTGLGQQIPEYRSLQSASAKSQAEIAKTTAETSKITAEVSGTLPASPAQAETARHNAAMEGIGRLTAGQSAASAAETRRHNLATEAISKDRTVPMESDMTSDYQTALSRAIMSIPAIRRGSTVQTANRLWREGNTTELQQVIKQAATESEPVDIRTQIRGREATLAALSETRQMLNDLKASGVPTNIIAGSVENAARTLGKSTNTKYVELGNRLMSTLIAYRRATTGVQFSQPEQQQYAQMFPNYKNDLPVNLALLDGLERDIRSNDRTFWESKLGPTGAALVGASTPAPKREEITRPSAPPPGFEIARPR